MADNKRYIVIETCDRESVSLGTFKTLEDAKACMRESFLEHARTVTERSLDEGDDNPAYERILAMIGEPGRIYPDEDNFDFSDTSAWSNLNDTHEDWNIFEVAFD